MRDPLMQREYPNLSERAAICIRQSNAELLEAVADNYYYQQYGYTETICDELYIPEIYEPFEDGAEEILLATLFTSKAVQYQDKKIILNKPFLTPEGPKKYGVYTKDNDNIVLVNFSNSSHQHSDPGPKWQARYWACRSW
jgi:hypothetical protein